MADSVDERDGVEKLKALVPTSFDDATYLRFLRARKHNVDAAAEMFSKFAAWRAEAEIEKLTLSDIRDEIAKARAWIHYRDREGRPCCIIKCNRHIAKENVVESVMKLVVYYFQTAENVLRASDEKFTLLIDFQDWTMANVDYAVMKELLHVLQNYYPERLGAAFIVFTPLLFSMVWKVIKHWLDQVTVSKVHLLGKKPQKDLLQHFDADKLPVCYGGTSDFVYDQEHYACDGILGILDTDCYVRPLGLAPGERVLYSAAEIEAQIGRPISRHDNDGAAASAPPS